MPKISQWFIKSAVVYLIIGMIGGIVMGAKEDFTLAPAHAHLNLIGWVTLFLMGHYYNAHPVKATRPIATIQFWVSTVGVWVMIPGLALTLLQVPIGGPLVIVGSLIVLIGVLIFASVIYRD